MFYLWIHAEETGVGADKNKGLQTGGSGVQVQEFLEVSRLKHSIMKHSITKAHFLMHREGYW